MLFYSHGLAASLPAQASVGERERAREPLNIATSMYREMDMPDWLEQAEREVRELA